MGGTGKSRTVSVRGRSRRVDSECEKLSCSPVLSGVGISAINGRLGVGYVREGTKSAGLGRRRGFIMGIGSLSATARPFSSSSKTDGSSGCVDGRRRVCGRRCKLAAGGGERVILTIIAGTSNFDPCIDPMGPLYGIGGTGETKSR
jgi:hypothetical protein